MDQIHDAVRQQFSQHAKYYAQSKVHAEGETHIHNALQPFSWWADRPGNSPEQVQQIRAAFDELTPEEEPIFAIQREVEEFYFAWPMYCVKARKPDSS